MSSIKVVTSRTTEKIQLGSVTMQVLEDGTLTDNRLGTVLSTLPPFFEAAPQHLHRMHDETFFVTQGTVRFTATDEEHDVKVGEYVVVSPGAPHTFSNPFDKPAVFLTTLTPAYYVNYFRELSEIISAGKEPTADQMITVRGHYATEPA